MNQEAKEFRELKFVCPQCGANSLRGEASGYLHINHVYDNGVFEFGDMNPEEIEQIDYYHCAECGYLLELTEDVGLAEWLMTHCSQEDSDPGQPDEHDSRMPPDNES